MRLGHIVSGGRIEDKGTARTEAFSDGVFAIAITLVALELRDPTLGTGLPLAEALIHEWPSFFAFVTSFVTILIMWTNHHNMFHYIRRTDRRFLLLNGILLLFVVVTPFTTTLVANHMLSGEARAAAVVYSGTFFLASVVWNGVWWYSSAGHRLLGGDVTEGQARSITRQYYVAPLAYGGAVVVALYSGLASVAVTFVVAGFYAVTATISRET